ncbi:CsbD family protein [Mycobacterium alsense]|uniref:CsbD family protein n=1 Tax=Mycobacterium alsense TaxID=324058 RepID=A0AA41XQH1_9MYCO|nr:CsbD family protein [Mycobacterium alsense]MCV7380420.1 CsbD family protein [Mycobacterium alsense]OQZ92055.1 CsbD family protein [Mycobacterium alsense]
MVDSNSGPIQLVRGIVEGVLGKAKEFVGMVIGRTDLVNEGEAQQDKADAQREAGRKEAAAEKARGEAKAHEERERAEQQ